MAKYGVRVTFPEPVSGYWDGGYRRGGVFDAEVVTSTPAYGMIPYYNTSSIAPHPGPGGTIKWGCWELNFHFNAKAGRSWREAAAIARRRLERLCRVRGTNIEVVTLS